MCDILRSPRTLYRVFPTLRIFALPSFACNPLPKSARVHRQACFRAARAHLERRHTDNEADDFIVPEFGRLKCLLCVFKSFIDEQTVKIDHSIGATLAPQEDSAHTAVLSLCDWSPYLVVLIEEGLRRLLIQILRCTPTHKDISFVQRFSIIFPFFMCALGPFLCFLLLALHAAGLLPEILGRERSLDDIVILQQHDVRQVDQRRQRSIIACCFASTGTRHDTLRITGGRGLRAGVNR
jgi:hypothetical protein